ncbi:hypothetical protein LEMLEM_LOCUS188 [Lemmus lemmus]
MVRSLGWGLWGCGGELLMSLQTLGGAKSRVGGPEEEVEAAQDEEAVLPAPARGRAKLAGAPALRAGGRAVSPQPPRRRLDWRLDWRLPWAPLKGGTRRAARACQARHDAEAEQPRRPTFCVMPRPCGSTVQMVGMIERCRTGVGGRGDVTFGPPGR